MPVGYQRISLQIDIQVGRRGLLVPFLSRMFLFAVCCWRSRVAENPAQGVAGKAPIICEWNNISETKGWELIWIISSRRSYGLWPVSPSFSCCFVRTVDTWPSWVRILPVPRPLWSPCVVCILIFFLFFFISDFFFLLSFCSFFSGLACVVVFSYPVRWHFHLLDWICYLVWIFLSSSVSQ